MDEIPDAAAPTTTAAGVRPVNIRAADSASAENSRPASLGEIRPAPTGRSGLLDDKLEDLWTEVSDDFVPAPVPLDYILEWGENKPSNRALCSDLDVDPDFFAAHSDGRRYRQRGWRRRTSDNLPPSGSATYSFPQILTLRVNKEKGVRLRLEQESLRKTSRTSRDEEAEFRTQDCPVAVFCRASIWESAHTSILLLDNSSSSTTLEDALMDALNDSARKHSATIAAGMVHSVVAQLVHDQWLDFFDTITTGGGARQPRRIHVNNKMYKDMAWVLEQNLVASRMHDKAARQARLGHAQDAFKSGGPNAPSPIGPPPAYEALDPVKADDWRELISRLDRMVAMLALQKIKKPGATEPSGITVPTVPAFGETVPARPTSGNFADIPATPPFSGTPQGQSSLSRVTYMGGILLPFSIIAGIMSMSDPYGPGNSMFWIYWAITIPITCLTLTIIYADDIQSMYVWQQISHERFQEAVRMGEAVPPNAVEEAVDAITDLGERIIPKPTSDEDSDIETGPVTHASRPAEPQSERFRRAAGVRVEAYSGPRRPTFYRIAEPVDTEIRRSTRVYATSASIPSSSRPERISIVHSQNSIDLSQGEAEVGEDDINSDQGNIELDSPVLRARRRPTARVNPVAFIPVLRIQRPTTTSNVDETLAIDMDRLSEDARPASAIGRRIGGRNIAPPGCPPIILQQGPDGSERIYRRERLGWAGALKSMVGYHKPPQA
ncbi:major facilitator superfamily transporter [Ophiostoma piceae UAMH 11346]|uniref:Major facilitator superfamily transporter n=1 Tax=Ophiostoma piceae (strain UAMH 11346) TaxID=1262450 RepID=S3CZA5_OPHP1|nr:major facilitator superfamily transporter [Ophiostoma piceae UAMH 11346]